jgi:glucose/arabinose dehydrogenase
MTLPATTSGRRDRLRLHGRGAAVACALSLALSGCAFGSSPDTTGQPPNLTPSPSPTPSTAAPSPSAAAGDQVLAKNLDVPWGLAFLPDGTALITERDTHRILEMAPGGKPTPVQTLRGIGGGGEGGLLGIAVSPRYEKDKTVFVYYTTATDNRIAKLRLGGRPVPILTGIPSANVHNGGRIAFGPDGYLYAGTGDGGERSNSQDRASLGGKILRMTPEGKPAPGNPFPGSVVWSLGHRNVQGLAWDSRKRLYAAEFGQNRFDELNLIRAGRNYGWPEVEGIGRRAGFVDPLQTWTTDQASPSGVAISGGIAVLACLRGERLYAVALDPRTGRVHGDPKVLLEGEYGRLRTVVAAPDGSIWVTTSNRDGRGEPAEDDDRILRIVPPGGGGVSVL